MQRFDIIIVGNGVLGLSTAFALVQKDKNLRVAVVGPFAREGSASAAAAAMLNYMAEVTPKMLASPYGRKRLEMGIQAAKLWPAWIETINAGLPREEQAFIKSGTYIVHNARSGKIDDDAFGAIMMAAVEYQEPCVEINPNEVPGLNPDDDSRPMRALHLPSEGYVDSSLLLNALTAKLRLTKQVEFIDACARTVKEDGQKVTSITTSDNQALSADKFIFAAGVFTQTLLDQLPSISSRIPPLLAGVGYAATIEQSHDRQIEHVIRTPNRSGACGLHVVPRGKNNLYIGATNNVEVAPEFFAKMGLSHFLFECAMAQVDRSLYNSRLLKTHVGNRPISMDTFPLIGKTSMHNLWLLTGTYRDGFHQSPLLADMISAEVLGLKSPVSCPEFKPERNLIQTATMAESLDALVEEFMGALAEHKIYWPRLREFSDLKAIYHEKVSRIYDKLGSATPLPSEVVFMVMLKDVNEREVNYLKNYANLAQIVETDRAA